MLYDVLEVFRSWRTDVEDREAGLMIGRAWSYPSIDVMYNRSWTGRNVSVLDCRAVIPMCTTGSEF